jgi:subfamily B ATP-binding cassette protein MsbA/ATP-binding cassette subfamily B protein AbcA/BmrA
MKKTLAIFIAIFFLSHAAVKAQAFQNGDMVGNVGIGLGWYSYGYGASSLPAISFSLEKGKSIALVGPSGSGKSTVLKLLCGFYRADSGSISVFGNDLDEDSIGSLRQKIALVSQDSYLFPGTVAENIACGAGDVPMERIIEAAKAANAHDFIADLKDGYGTRIGQEGSLLSGGQKQRISIARAVLKNTEILLLDEPTSALDAESEAHPVTFQGCLFHGLHIPFRIHNRHISL